MSGDKRRHIATVLGDTASFYHRSLSEEAVTYLTQRRKLSQDIIERFQIGFANGGLKDHLIMDRHHTEELCLAAGVLKKEENGETRDFFWRRIIFPNIRQGSVVHLTGREFGGAGPKYLHLPGEITFLFNEDALDGPDVLVTEGPADCITATQFGYRAVALLGASGFKPEYVQRFGRCEKIYICLDRDPAGEAGASRIGGLFPDRAYVIQLPPGADVNEYLGTHSRGDFQALIAGAKKYLRYMLDPIAPDIDRTELPRMLDPIIRALSRMNPAEAEHFLSEDIKRRFGLRAGEIGAYRKLINETRRSDRRARPRRTSSGNQEIRYCAKFDGLVDLVEHEGVVSFLIRNEAGVTVVDRVEINGEFHHPPPKKQIPWLLPKSDRVMAAFESCRAGATAFVQGLYDDLVRYFRAASDLPDDLYYDLLTVWSFHTYLLEAVQNSPIICLFSVPERGKTRSGKALIYVAYRGMHVESLREAYIVRVAENYGCSIFFDVMNVWRKAELSGSEDILLHRFEKGATVPRVIYPERGPYKDTVYYSIFGPTIIATNEGIHKLLETRAIYINMPQASRNFENDVIPESALELKERLVAFRAFHLGQDLPEAQKPCVGRLGDILKPLLQTIRLVNPQKEAGFMALTRNLERDRLMEKSTSLEAEIIYAVNDLTDQVWNGFLPVKAVTDVLNTERPEKSRLTYQRVGRILSAMGFRKGRTSDGAAAIYYDNQQVIQILESYGLEETSVTPETPVPRELDREDS
jgi:hypothetical protein